MPLKILPLHEHHLSHGAALGEFQGTEVVRVHTDVVAEHRAARTRAAVTDLSGLGRVWLRGKDAQDYLHRCLTNHIKRLPVGAGCHAAFLSAVGRMVAEMGVHRVSEVEFLCITVPACAERLATEFDKYLFGEDCRVSPPAKDEGLLGLFGPLAGELASSLLRTSACPAAPWACATWHFHGTPLLVIRSRLLGPEGLLLIAPGAQLRALWEALVAAGFRPLGFEALQVLRIEQGVPLYGQDHDHTWLPSDAGLEAEVIDFTKGCFPGQEVVAKIHNLSHPREVLRGFVFSAPQPPPVGVPLLSADGQVGSVTSACQSPTLGKAIGLGHLKWKSSQVGQTLRVGADGEHGTAEVVDLPFAV